MKPQKLLESEALRVLAPLDRWAMRCHEASLELVRAGVADRVARGTCVGVGGQHSWAVVGRDCYDPAATIIDAVLWSYLGQSPRVVVTTLGDSPCTPHGAGDIWAWGKPENCHPAAAIELTPRSPLSADALLFLELLGPLNRLGWGILASRAPVGGWPAGEILAAMDDTEELSALVPIDRLGMNTDRNPGGVYLRGVES